MGGLKFRCRPAALRTTWAELPEKYIDPTQRVRAAGPVGAGAAPAGAAVACAVVLRVYATVPAGAASLEACTDECNADTTCTAIEWYPSTAGWLNVKCHRFPGTPGDGGSSNLPPTQGGGSYLDAQCYIKAPPSWPPVTPPPSPPSPPPSAPPPASPPPSVPPPSTPRPSAESRPAPSARYSPKVQP